MVLSGEATDYERIGDRRIACAADQQPQHLDLARTKRLARLGQVEPAGWYARRSGRWGGRLRGSWAVENLHEPRQERAPAQGHNAGLLLRIQIALEFVTQPGDALVRLIGAWQALERKQERQRFDASGLRLRAVSLLRHELGQAAGGLK